jgi:DNA-binding LacI/PurR family transcriptional regulator
MATGVYRILHERNLSIPEMVSVCGCDDLPVGEQLYPELTTIALDYNELAACAVNHILSGKSTTVFPEIKLPPVLRIKKSTVF